MHNQFLCPIARTLCTVKS